MQKELTTFADIGCFAIAELTIFADIGCFAILKLHLTDIGCQICKDSENLSTTWFCNLSQNVLIYKEHIYVNPYCYVLDG